MLLLVSIVLAATVLLACMRYGTRSLLPLVLLVSFALTATVHPDLGVSALIGFIAAVQVERRRGYDQVIVASAAPAAVQALFLLMEKDEKAKEEAIELFMGQMQQFESLGLPQDILREFVGLYLRLEPGLQFCAALLTAVLAYRLSLQVGGYFNVSLPPALPFRLWRPWEQLIWVLIGALVLQLADIGVLADLAVNVVLVTGVLYTVQGMALLRFYIWHRRIPRPVEILIYVGLLFSGYLAVLSLAGLGLLDTWFDWRRLGADAEQPPDANES